MINSTENVNMAAPPKVIGLTEYEQEAFERLFEVWSQKLTRNKLRMKYYRKRNALKDLGIAIPPKLKTLETVLGWPAKAVDMLAARSIFDGFVYEDDVDSRIEDVLRMNRFKLMYRQATKSELVHSCAFATVSKGAEGEPPVLVSFYSAENGAVIWDSRLKREECGFTIVKLDEKNNTPTWINLYTNEAVIEIRKEDTWRAVRKVHNQGRPLIFALVHCPDLDRPLGKSRITRSVMSLTDSATRTALRSEVSAEFFTSPQKYLLGIQEGFFDDNPKWDAYIGNIMAITENPETGTVPQFGQLPQGTMQPHVDYLRSLAASFSGETNIPINALGIIHDNPASAEAMRTAESYLIMDAEDLNETNGDALRNIGLMVHAILNGTTVDRLSDAEKSIEPRFRNPSMPSVVSQSDAIITLNILFTLNFGASSS